MIIEYNPFYEDQVVKLFTELQEYIVKIDKEGYNIITEEYGKKYLNKTQKEVNENEGKIYLYKEDNKILGVIVGIVNNNEVYDYDFKAPKRGKVTELITLKDYRKSGIGSKLLKRIEEYFISIGCKATLLDVFAYNEDAKAFYEKNGYHSRMVEMIKVKE